VKAPIAWAFSAAATSAGQLAASQAALVAEKDFRRNFRLAVTHDRFSLKLIVSDTG